MKIVAGVPEAKYLQKQMVVTIDGQLRWYVVKCQEGRQGEV